MAKKTKREYGYVSLAIRPETREALRRLERMIQADARAQGIPARISAVDAVDMAVREAIERREGAQG